MKELNMSKLKVLNDKPTSSDVYHHFTEIKNENWKKWEETFDEKYKDIPVIMYTARAQEADEKLGLEVGADAYMTKPFDPGKLLAKIKELLEKDRRQDGQ